MAWSKRVGGVLCLLAAAGAWAGGGAEDDNESKQWQEIEVALPGPVREDALLPFFVSAATANRFFVDGSSLTVDRDGVVRYALVVLVPEGGRNVTYEGMRCETRERRIYASGRLDGTWSKSRVSQWVRIQDAAANRHHAALFLEYFCPGGVVAKDPGEVRNALKRGGYPGVRMLGQ